MTTFQLSSYFTINSLLAHLVQSTGFVVLVWFLTFAMRNYPARARFSVWMASSIKFFVPFALLTALGGRWARPNPGPSTYPTIGAVIEEINRPLIKSDLVSCL